MKAFKLLSLSIAAALALGATSAALAQANDDRWEISAGYFKPDVRMSGNVQGSVTDGVTTEPFNESGRVSDRFDGAQLEATWRFSPRQRLVGGWYTIGQDKSWSRQEAGTYVPEDGSAPVDYDVNGRVGWDTNFDLYRLSYGFDVFQGKKTTVTALVGAYGAKIDTSLTSSGTAVIDGETYDLAGRVGLNETRYAPGLGLSAEWSPTERWDLRASAQGFRTQWGDFDTRGHFYNAQVQAGYRITPRWTGFVGYDWFDLKLQDQTSFETTQDGTLYTGQALATGRLKIHGPVVGIRASF